MALRVAGWEVHEHADICVASEEDLQVASQHSTGHHVASQSMHAGMSLSFSVYKVANCCDGTSPSLPHLIPITSQRLHLCMPQTWISELRLNTVEL